MDRSEQLRADIADQTGWDFAGVNHEGRMLPGEVVRKTARFAADAEELVPYRALLENVKEKLVELNGALTLAHHNGLLVTLSSDTTNYAGPNPDQRLRLLFVDDAQLSLVPVSPIERPVTDADDGGE